jgi:hypothetical protein
MRLASLSLVGLLVGACFDPTLTPNGADVGSGSAGTSSETGSSEASSSSASSDTTPSLDDTGATDDASSSTGVGASSDEGSRGRFVARSGSRPPTRRASATRSS